MKELENIKVLLLEGLVGLRLWLLFLYLDDGGEKKINENKRKEKTLKNTKSENFIFEKKWNGKLFASWESVSFLAR